MMLVRCLSWAVMQLAEYFNSNLKAAPEALGDPQREAPEDIQERYERVVASSFSSLSALLVLYSEGLILPCKLENISPGAICFINAEQCPAFQSRHHNHARQPKEKLLF